MVSTWWHLPERGGLLQLKEDGTTQVWIQSKLPGVWRPAEAYLDQWWDLVGVPAEPPI